MRAIAAFSGWVAKPALKSSRRQPSVAFRKRHGELGVSGPRIISLVLTSVGGVRFLAGFRQGADVTGGTAHYDACR